MWYESETDRKSITSGRQYSTGSIIFVPQHSFPQSIFIDMYGGEKKKKEKNKLGYYVKSVPKDSWFGNLILKLVGSRVHNILAKMLIVQQNQTLTEWPGNPLDCHIFSYRLFYTLSVKNQCMHITDVTDILVRDKYLQHSSACSIMDYMSRFYFPL